MNINLLKSLSLLYIFVFSLEALSETPPEGLAIEHERACIEIGGKVLEKMPLINSNLSKINESLVTLELEFSEYNNCFDRPVSRNSYSTNCEIAKKSYDEKIKEHALLVSNNEQQQKEMLSLFKEYSNKHCPIN